MSHSVLQNQMMLGPISQQKTLRPKNGQKKKNQLMFSLNLTALIDAFSILVIFLLSNMNDGLQNLEFKQGFILPNSSQSQAMGLGTVIRVEKGYFFVDNKQMDSNQLIKMLLEVKKENPKDAIIIQADQRENYEIISQVIRAAGQAGIEKYMLAVLPVTSAGI